MRGFTVLEMLLSVAILALLAGIGVPVYSSFNNRNELDVATQGTVSHLRRAQALSRAVDGDSSWGVYLATGTATLFRGVSYATRDGGTEDVLAYPSTIEISGDKEFIFTKFTGELPSPQNFSFTGPDSASTTISVNEKGTVFY